MNASSSDLAIYGGPIACHRLLRDGWRRHSFKDLLHIGKYILNDVSTTAGGGGEVGTLEREFKRMVGADYALLMNSGTSAIHSAYHAVGVTSGTEVIVPGYTFPASATPALLCGAEVVFCDVDPKTLLIDPEDVKRKLTSRTRAICAVHVWGNPCPMDELVGIGKEAGVAVIEDASHAPGGVYKGRKVGGIGDIGCFSLQGRKAVTGGEAGIALTNNRRYMDRMLALGHFGRTGSEIKSPEEDVDGFSLGAKYRPHLFAAVMALSSLRRLDELNKGRRDRYRWLSEELGDCAAVSPIERVEGCERGGLLEFVFRYDRERCGGWPIGSFVQALNAEGVPAYVDRYSRLGKNKSTLSESPLFGERARNAACGLAGCRSLRDSLFALQPMTTLSESRTRQCAAAISKVCRAAAAITSYR